MSKTPLPAARVSPDARGRVLAVDDSPTVLDWLAAVLGDDFQVETASSCGAARAAVARTVFHAIIADFELGDGNGLDLLKHAMQGNDKLAGILMTAHKDYGVVREAQRSGRVLVLFKPVEARELLAWVKNAVTMSKLTEATTKIQSGGLRLKPVKVEPRDATDTGPAPPR